MTCLYYIQVMGVADALTRYPDLLKPFFVSGSQAPLTGGEEFTPCTSNDSFLIFTDVIKNLFYKGSFFRDWKQ